jgi:endonuclease/exonuclease/phosphatase family metal-dependent hydrolase
MGVFYRKDRLKAIDSGNYWLSETPEEPGSIAWNMSLPRMVTWAEFEDVNNGRRFHYVNTHFAHRREDEDARTRSARLIAERLRKLPASSAIVMTGDFNTDAGSEPYKVLTEILRDTWTAVANPTGPTGTFHGFSGKPRTARIDWILFRGPLKAVSIETLTDNENGRYPSDHFPVLAVYEWGTK